MALYDSGEAEVDTTPEECTRLCLTGGHLFVLLTLCFLFGILSGTT
jgi:hypothetical protein